MSTTKLFLLGGLIGAGIPLLAGIGGGITIGGLIGRMIFSGIITGAPISFFGKWYQAYKYERSKAEAETDGNYNGSFQETDEDVKRQRDAERFNQGNENYYNNDNDRFRFVDNDGSIKEKLILLNLDPKTLPMDNELKIKYLDAIKKWHPDTYKGDKVLATKMYSQINSAYAVLLETIKKENNK